MIVVILALTLSILFALFSVPRLATFAHRVGLVDKPDDKRKLHQTPIPMVGGLSLFITVLLIAPLMICVGLSFPEFFQEANAKLLSWIPVDFYRRKIGFNPEDFRELTGLVIGSAVLVVVGILDDRFAIRGRQKLFGQIVATTVLILFGFHFEEITFAGFHIKFDIFSIFFVYAWVLAAINSVNLLDGADGIAGTIGVIMSFSLALMAIFQGQMLNAIITITIGGALIGFLRYNFPPAKVYLGDTGSMLIGFLLAAMAIRCTFKQSYAFAFFAPIAFLAIPFIDTAAAIIRRRLTGRSIFAVDRGHLHHSLMKRGYSPRISLLWVTLLSTMTAVGGILAFINRQSEYALVSIGLVLIVMLSCRIFGIAEYQLVSRKASSLAKSVFKYNQHEVEKTSVHVQGSRDWKVDWEKLCKFADQHGLSELTLDLNAPWLHESFHATRKTKESVGPNQWQTEIPLITKGKCFGRIEIIADQRACHHKVIKALLDITSDIESAMVDNATSEATKIEPQTTVDAQTVASSVE